MSWATGGGDGTDPSLQTSYAARMASSPPEHPLYLAVREIAIGGQGELWEVEHPGLETNVVMKVVRADRAHDAMAHHRLKTESQIQARLRHPNVVPVLERAALPDGRP